MSLLPDPSSQVNPIYYQADRNINTINHELGVNQQGIEQNPWEEQYMLSPMLPSLGDYFPVQ